MSKPVLSLILCSRNDRYMGNSLWRLQTSLNYAARMVHELGRDEDVEIVVSDWGSETPLRDVLELSPNAARLVSFILIPPETARDLQKDSPFAEVLALNAAARRASGEYIGRIDQDTLVGRRFLEFFFDVHEGRRKLDASLDSVLLFANQRMVPYRFVVRTPSLWAMDRYVDWFGRFFKVEVSPRNPWDVFYKHGVGIWLIHKKLWDECGGYDEGMIYMNTMETNMISRLLKKHEMINLGRLVNYDFYHLEHYHPFAPRRSSTHRKVNPGHLFTNYDILNPNGPDWGLVRYHFDMTTKALDGNRAEMKSIHAPRLERLFFVFMIAGSGVQMAADKISIFFRTSAINWKRRAGMARETVRHQRFFLWPRLLLNLWKQKRRARKGNA